MQRILRLELLKQALGFRLRLLDGHARAEPADHGVIPAPVARVHPELQRVPEIRLRFVTESRRHDPDDRDGTIVQRDGLADRARKPAEHALPQAVADHGHAIGAGHALFGEKTAAHRR